MQVATLSVLTGVCFVITMAMLLHHNMNAVLTRWGDEVKISIYLQDGISESSLSLIQDYLKKDSKVEKFKYVSGKEALFEFKQKMSSVLPQLMSSDEFENPLPSSFEVSFKSSAQSQKGFIEKYVAETLKLKGIDDISYGQTWVKNYSAFVGVFNTASWVLVGILLCGGLLVIGNSIRNAIHQRREEIEILELIGATRNMIVFPYVIEGAIMGVIASTLSLVIGYMLFSSQAHFFSSQLGFWGMGAQLSFLSVFKVLFIIVLGSLSGALGSYICIRKLSNGWCAAMDSSS